MNKEARVIAIELGVILLLALLVGTSGIVSKIMPPTLAPSVTPTSTTSPFYLALLRCRVPDIGPLPDTVKGGRTVDADINYPRGQGSYVSEKVADGPVLIFREYEKNPHQWQVLYIPKCSRGNIDKAQVIIDATPAGYQP